MSCHENYDTKTLVLRTAMSDPNSTVFRKQFQ